MKSSSVYIYQPIVVNTWYECILYILGPGVPSELRVGDILTDTSANSYRVDGFYQIGTPSNNETNWLFQDGNKLKLSFITNDVIPLGDTDYNSNLESPVIPSYLPDVKWSSIPYDVLNSVPAYHYECKFGVNVSTEPGAGEIDVGYYFVDFDGNIYEVVSVINTNPVEVRIYDINEIANNSPSTNLGFVYKSKRDAVIMSQSEYYRLDQASRDLTNNIEKAVLWEHRGMQLESGSNVYPNVTRLDIQGLTITEQVGDGWVGGDYLRLAADFSGVMVFRGSIINNGDFPSTPETGDFYTITGTSVTDPYHTGQSFVQGDEIVFDGTDWVYIGQIPAGAQLVRYFASTTTGEEVEVLASGSNGQITYSRTGNIGTFSITSGARLISARCRIPGTVPTSGQMIFDMGTVDMGNTNLANRWAPQATVNREDTGNQVPITLTLDLANNARVTVNNLPSDTTSQVRLVF